MICISFDTDHMNEARMAEFLRDIAIPGAGTFFCTQRYDCLEGSRHELCPHPFLPSGGDWESELDRMRKLFPGAKGWRAHSCVFSHLLAEWLAANGYRYASTNDQFGQSGIQPVRHPWGVWHLPIFYMDNMDFSSGHFWKDQVEGQFSDRLIEIALGDDGVYVFDFHPVHLLLNTPNRDRYFAMRDRFKAGERIEALAYDGFGTRNFYVKLCEQMTRRGTESFSLSGALDRHLQSPRLPGH
jgi:hypothetical protein